MKRLECLDGLRGVLAVYVMISHMAPFAALPAWMVRPWAHGGAAVDVFFILSGLVIVGSLRKFDYQPRPFLLARVARIYPVFLVVFALAIAVHALPPALESMTWLEPEGLAYRMWASGWPSHWPVDVFAHLTMTHGLFPNGTYPHIWVSVLGASWSLSTEWQFYVLALLIGGILARRGWSAGLAWVFLAIGVAGAAWAALMPESFGFSRAFLGNKGGYFALGVVSAVVIEPGDDPRSRRRAWLAYGLMLGLVLALCWHGGGPGKLAAPLVWTLCLCAQLGLFRWLRPLAAVLGTAVLQWLGALSYGIYLVNEPVQRALGTLLVGVTGADAVLFTWLWIPSAILLPILAALWLHKYVELPGQAWGRRVGRRSGVMASVRGEAPIARITS